MPPTVLWMRIKEKLDHCLPNGDCPEDIANSMIKLFDEWVDESQLSRAPPGHWRRREVKETSFETAKRT